MKAEVKKVKFEEFLKTARLLIVDKSSASRRRLVKTFVDLGASRQNIDSLSQYDEAIEIINTKKPNLMLSDYVVNGGSGFDLFKTFREKYPEEKKSVLILVTSNISQSAVAQAAEEDVDSFIIKPYTVTSLEASLTNTVIAKLFPSEYVKQVELGKEALFDKEFEKALEIFEGATKLNKKPSLALFYHGQTKYFLKDKDAAKDDYEKGLAINSIHFKCQIGLYELYIQQEEWGEAYSVVKNIAEYFPANPDRLMEVVRLAIKTESYSDMELYYELFLKLDSRSDDVVNYVCSGMFICGKFYLREQDLDAMRKIFEKIAISCAGSVKFLREMILVLVSEKIYDDAQKIMNRFPNDNESKNDYMICTYLANSGDYSSVELIGKGQELFNEGIKHPACMKILIDTLYLEENLEKAKQYLEEAQYIWPEIFNGYGTKQTA